MSKQSQNKQSEFSKILQFREELNKVENNIQQEIRETIGLVGVSIQLKEEEQDGNTPTRGQKADINDYCQFIQKSDNCFKCNKFDVEAKNYSLFKSKNQKNILFNCHAGVSNLLIPFKPKYSDYVYK